LSQGISLTHFTDEDVAADMVAAYEVLEEDEDDEVDRLLEEAEGLAVRGAKQGPWLELRACSMGPCRGIVGARGMQCCQATAACCDCGQRIATASSAAPTAC
jgi:hypothetical protein